MHETVSIADESQNWYAAFGTGGKPSPFARMYAFLFVLFKKATSRMLARGTLYFIHKVLCSRTHTYHTHTYALAHPYMCIILPGNVPRRACNFVQLVSRQEQ
jgi:hypothetical protein